MTNLSAQAKILATQFPFEAINDEIQWYGAYGYTLDCNPELALKGVRGCLWAEGALETMRIIVSRDLLGKEFFAYR